MAFKFEDLNVRSFEQKLQKNKTVILPIAVLEQHGFHLPFATDVYNVTEVLSACFYRIDAFVAPVVPYSYSGGELAGTLNISPNIFSQYISEICTEFLRNGFKNIILFQGHGGTDNSYILECAIRMIFKKNPFYRDRCISIVNCWELSDTWMSYFSNENHEFHADIIETSLMMYWHPELVEEIVLDEPEILANMMTDQDWFEEKILDVDNRFVVPKTLQRKEIKVGVMGTPQNASRELGKIVAKEMEDGLVDFVNLINNNVR